LSIPLSDVGIDNPGQVFFAEKQGIAGFILSLACCFQVAFDWTMPKNE
jgi:hypothetical protein